MAVCQNLVPLVNIKIAGKWMFIPLKMVLIGIDPYPYLSFCQGWCVYIYIGSIPLMEMHLSSDRPLSRGGRVSSSQTWLGNGWKWIIEFDDVWLVVEPTPVKNDGVSELGWWNSQSMEKKVIFQTTNQMFLIAPQKKTALLRIHGYFLMDDTRSKHGTGMDKQTNRGVRQPTKFQVFLRPTEGKHFFLI